MRKPLRPGFVLGRRKGWGSLAPPALPPLLPWVARVAPSAPASRPAPPPTGRPHDQGSTPAPAPRSRSRGRPPLRRPPCTPPSTVSGSCGRTVGCPGVSHPVQGGCPIGTSTTSHPRSPPPPRCGSRKSCCLQPHQPPNPACLLVRAYSPLVLAPFLLLQPCVVGQEASTPTHFLLSSDYEATCLPLE